MRRIGCFCLLLGIISSSALISAACAGETTVIAIGDSWGYGLAEPIDRQFAKHGHGDQDVLNLAVPGSTASLYASDGSGVLDASLAALVATPSVEVVWISLGGNDLIARYPVEGNSLFERIESDLRHIVDRILDVRPDVEILFAGYDILKFDKSQFCLLFASSQFGSILPWEITPLFMEIGNRQQAIADDYPEVSYLPLWGTGQGAPGSPNILSWSPSDYVAGPAEDCVHLSDSGYNRFAGEIYCGYFAPRLGEPCGSGPSCSLFPAAASPGTSPGASDIANTLVLFLLPFTAILLQKLR